ncbi:tyrosine-type recombinase/integrase [Actinoplanes sp. NPDC051851]|uniref:tyrosine-type recombinase/integrase n=1 Tax=Actinoplanes sp. NPDC051851 TaxID=3154753 RepID=UPI00341C7021
MHEDFNALLPSWELDLQADRYPPTTRRSYVIGVHRFGAWLYAHHPGVSPLEAKREHIRGWLADANEKYAVNSTRAWLTGIRHFHRWLVREGEAKTDPTEGVRGPKPGETATNLLSESEVSALLSTCNGTSFKERRDTAIIYVFFDGGVRLAENSKLEVEDFNLQSRMIFVKGKGTNRSGPRVRAVPLGVKGTRAVDRYIRERRKHPFAELPQLWLGDRNRGPITREAIRAMLETRAAQAGIKNFHPHMARHTWASEFRKAGGEEGDLMVLGGWRSRQMLDRYGKIAAVDRAQSSYRKRSFGDRI